MKSKFKDKLYEIVFEADTPAGKFFDVALLSAIFISITLVMLESISSVNEKYGYWLKITEWIVTIFFTIEYFLRIYIVKKPLNYIFSFYGIVDFLSVVPSYIGLFIPGTHGLTVIRSLRLLRIFRILKLDMYVKESSIITRALIASKRKIGIFLYFVIMLVIIIGTVMYLVEDNKAGFTSIPQSIYWAVVTLTTVGYGDIAPITPLGKFIAGFVMILGYAIIAVPTGIVSSEMISENKKTTTQCCPICVKEGHDENAEFCKFCGAKLNNDIMVQ